MTHRLLCHFPQVLQLCILVYVILVCGILVLCHFNVWHVCGILVLIYIQHLHIFNRLGKYVPDAGCNEIRYMTEQRTTAKVNDKFMNKLLRNVCELKAETKKQSHPVQNSAQPYSITT